MGTQRRRTANDVPQSCRICGSPAVARGLCRRCYARARRGAPPLSEYGRARNGDGTQITFRLERYLRHLVAMLAQQEGVQDAEWLRRAVTERADRQLEHLSNSSRQKS
ncbi:MAG TPA: hypothetical protein VFB81_17110 [Myxococcales bacterium]|nr:hypothetical protein [Myxococcales bacterium]